MKRALAASVFGFGLLMTGCMHPSAPVVLHTLRSLETTQAPATTMALEVLPIRLPELLLRPQLVLAQGSDRMSLSETHHWGNGLDRDIQRVLIQNLSALLGNDAIVVYPEGPRVKAAYQLDLDVQRLEGQLGGPLVLEATWTLMKPGQPQAILHKRTRILEAVSGQDMDALIAAHNRAIQALSREIAIALKGL